MLGRIAKLYYEYDLTHQQIADLIGWSRVKVTRALADAREQGIVQITVVSDESVFLDEERGLIDKYGLRTVQVGPPSVEGNSGLARTGAECMVAQVEDGMQIAVGLSQTLAAIARAANPDQKPGTTFVPLQGTNPGLVTAPTPSNIAQEFGLAFGGQVHALAAPVFALSSEMHRVLADDVHVKQAFATAQASDIALVGVGGTADESSIVMRGHLNADEAEELRQAGAVGDVNARFFDGDGQPVETERTALVLGLTLEEFREIPLRIAAAAGLNKVDALDAALRSGIINGLVTDEPTAKALLLR